MTLLRLQGVSRRFGGVVAVDAVDLSIEAGELASSPKRAPEEAQRTSVAISSSSSVRSFEKTPLYSSEACHGGISRARP